MKKITIIIELHVSSKIELKDGTKTCMESIWLTDQNLEVYLEEPFKYFQDVSTKILGPVSPAIGQPLIDNLKKSFESMGFDVEVSDTT